MNEIDKVRLLADLQTEHCHLYHGPDTRAENFSASDYIVMPFGYAQDSIKEVAEHELIIPVCHQCARALTQDEWTLLYCFECNHSSWVYRRKAKNRYRHHILWLRGCPDCTNRLGGLYFNDLSDTSADVQFVFHPREHEAA